MYKGAARSQQLYSRTGNEATRPSAKGFSMLGGGVDVVAVLDDSQKEASRRAAIVRELEVLKIKQSKVREEIRECLRRNNRGPAYHDALSRQKKYAARLGELQLEVSKFKKARPVGQFFMDVCRTRLSQELFEQLMNEALQLRDAGASHNTGGKE